MGAGNIEYGVTNKTNISGVIEISKVKCSVVESAKRTDKSVFMATILSNNT